MENNENKKSNIGLIIVIIIVILLLLFAVWYFLLRDKGTTTNGGSGNNGGEATEKDKPVDKKTVEYTYTDGVLTRIVDEEGNPLQNEFVINGLILVGNRHSYANLEVGSEGIMEKLVAGGYKKEGINSSFYLNEWIEFYIDTAYAGNNSDVKIMAVPHDSVEAYQKLSLTELEELATSKGCFVIDYQTPEADNYKYVGNGYINMDYPEGKYDILFTYKGKLAYFVEVSLTKETDE